MREKLVYHGTLNLRHSVTCHAAEYLLPDMERTRMRVALLCCWLDCDSSFAGASLVIRVCSDGSDLQNQDKEIIGILEAVLS